MNEPMTRMQMVQAYVPPLCEQLGISIAEIEPDRCVMQMPFKAENVTIGDVVHGGAISSLADMAVTVAAWAVDEVPESMAGSTAALTVNFARAAKGIDLRAEGRVLKRGRRLISVEHRVTGPEGELVAHGVGTYALG